MSKIKLKQPIFSIEKINNNLLNKKRNITLNNNQLTSTNSFIHIQEENFEKKLSSNGTNNVNNAKNNIAESTGDLSESNTKSFFKKGKWSEDEDILLMKYVNKFGVGNWSQIEKHFIGRSRKQIRQRYINNTKIKKISEENKQCISINSDYSSSEDDEEENKYKDNIQKLKNENNNAIFNWDDKLDQILLKEYFLNKKSWVKISKKIPGSSENSVKNRFYSLLRQKVNKIKKEYKYKYINNFKHNNHENNNDIILLIKKEISINTEKSLNGNNINSDGKKENIFKNYYFDFESYLFNNKSKKKNYSVEILLEFLPELMEEKGINISEILDKLKERKNTAAQKIFIIIEKHYNSYNNKNLDDNDISSISTDIEFDNLQSLQSEKLSIVIKNMKLKIMYKYFHRFRYNTLGL
jgi:hypothetical protein